MSELFDAWGSPGYAMLTAACRRAAALYQAYETRGRLSDLEGAIALWSQVLAAAVNVDIRSGAASDLGIALWSRYERNGDPADLDTAITLFREALALYPEEPAPGVPSFFANLAGALRLRWLRTGSSDDLTESVAAIRASLAVTPPRHSRRSGRMSHLADCLLALHLRHGDSAALAEAVGLYRQAVECAADDAGLASARANLAEALRQTCRTTGCRRAVLDEAADLARAALAATPRGPLRPRFQSNLALILLNRFQRYHDQRDLAEAAAASGAAVAATEAGHPDRPQRLGILAEIACARMLSTDGVAGAQRRGVPRRAEARALNRLIKITGAAAQELPDGHFLQAGALLRHGSSLALQAVAGHRTADAAAASIACFRRVALDPQVPVSARIAAGQRWAAVAVFHGDGPAAMEAFELAVGLLPHAAPRSLSRADRERQLGDFDGLARDAAACAIGAGRPDLGLQLLEIGRGVLLGQALDARTQLTALREQAPELARRFEQLRDALDRPELFAVPGDLAQMPMPGEDQRAAQREWELLLATIREVPGFERFLQPPRADELLAATAEHGPVVVLNVSGLRCDALLLAEGRLEVRPLGLNQAELLRRVGGFQAALARAQATGTADRQIPDTLEWLWAAVAEPVLDALRGLAGSSAVWWIPTGALTALPLHAAGLRDRPGASVLDRVVSSYAVTVRGLVDAWRASRLADPPTALIVAASAAPGAPALPMVQEEAARLTDRLPGARMLTEQGAIRAAVLDALPGQSWVHFACHAVSELDQPGKSHLVLHDHASAPLTVADVAALRLDNAQLAYLSACETGVSRKELSDEAVHIAGAFHLAGFPHVIGTLWPVQDAVAADVADQFYAELLAMPVQSRRPAHALHAAVHRVRMKYPDAPALWAQYLHVGA